MFVSISDVHSSLQSESSLLFLISKRNQKKWKQQHWENQISERGVEGGQERKKERKKQRVWSRHGTLAAPRSRSSRFHPQMLSQFLCRVLGEFYLLTGWNQSKLSTKLQSTVLGMLVGRANRQQDLALHCTALHWDWLKSCDNHEDEGVNRGLVFNFSFKC